MKKLLNVLTLFTISTILSLCVFSSPLKDASEIIGSWYGQYTGQSYGTPVQRYMNMHVSQCNSDGSFSGNAQITTVEGQGLDYEWVNYKFEGKIDVISNTFYMQGYQKTSSSGGNWSLIPFNGYFATNADGELYVEGIADYDQNMPFYFARVSEWAVTEITEANLYELVPEPLKKTDMSKPVTRAEFAAISVQLYERLTKTKAPMGDTPFTDIASSEYKEYIKKAYSLGLTAGMTETTFVPDSYITREQLATMLCRTVKAYSFKDWTLKNDAMFKLDIQGVKPYADDEYISEYAKPSVYYLTKHGIISGINETHFAPKNPSSMHEAQGYATATREQALAMSVRIYKNSELWTPQ